MLENKRSVLCRIVLKYKSILEAWSVTFVHNVARAKPLKIIFSRVLFRVCISKIVFKLFTCLQKAEV